MEHSSFQIFKISSRKDVNEMQKLLLKKKEELEKQYIALELAENMIDAGEKGEIHINGIQVINKVYNKSQLLEVKEVISQAKFFKQQHLTGRINGEGKNPKNSLGGKGLLSIIHTGWDIEVHEDTFGFSIAATRPTAELSLSPST